jgi:hypothetical protein
MPRKLIILPSEPEAPPEPDLVVTPEELGAAISTWLHDEDKCPHPDNVQANLSALVALALARGEIYFAAAMMLVSNARSGDILPETVEAILNAMSEQMPRIAIYQKCRVCGCRNGRPCSDGCEWVQIDLCSRCAGG